MINEINGVPYHKTTINIPLSMYEEMKREASVLGINFNALILIKLDKLKEQKTALDTLSEILSLMHKEDYEKLLKGATIKSKSTDK